MRVLRGDELAAPAAEVDVVVHDRPEAYDSPALVMLRRDVRVLVRRPHPEVHRYRRGDLFRADAEIVGLIPDAFYATRCNVRRAA